MLHVHRAERSDRLAEALADVLAEPLADPFAAEVVAVPTRGIERWLAQRLSHRLGTGEGTGDGVCANVEFPSPAELVARALGTPADDPWRPERLVWPLLEVVDACVGEDWCAALAHYLGADDDPAAASRRGRRFAAARHVAGLFDRYGEHRPEMVRAWAAKDDADTPADLAWQPELWRRLRERLGVPSPAETLEDACAALESGALAAPFPARLSLYGPTRLSATHLRVLAALAATREVHLWLPHPSPAMWREVAEGPPAGPRRADGPAPVHHPLLASLGRDVRELQVRLRPLDPVDHHHDEPTPRPDTLLGLLQRDLREDRAPHGAALAPDTSVRVHACHGADRQVEVLRETILGLLADDPTLEPRDVVVLCPDIETFAPLLTASFGGYVDDAAEDGGAERHPGHRLRVRLADRALTQVNPLLATAATLLSLADARVTASQVLDLAESAPVRRRFRLDDDDLERLRALAAASGVRWGLDAGHRRSFRLQGFAENTWDRGLDRLLLGVAMSEDEQHWLDSALPLDDVDSGDVTRVGALAELLDRLDDVLGRLRGEHPLEHWVTTVADALDALTRVTPADAWQVGHARATLAGVLAEAGGSGGLLGLTDARTVFAEGLRGRPSRANFRTGTLTVATLVPMRSVPHRVVCLLGLDDQVFPRQTRPDGDDVLARDPRVGERDPASEDRQLLLDALSAAGEHLVVVHSGADERTNLPRPPAVPLGELLDALDATATVDGVSARTSVTVDHPLQPFSPRAFATGAPPSYDRTALAGARALERGRGPVRPFLDAPLPARPPVDLALDDLVRFVEHPVRAFLRQRLGVFARGEESEPDEALPVELDGLAEWAVGEQLLADRLAGRDVLACMEAEVRRGRVPPGALGDRVLRAVGQKVEPLVLASAPFRTGEAHDADVTVALDDATTLSGSVPGVRTGAGSTVLDVTFSRLGPKHRLRAWVRLLALQASRPEECWSAVVIGKGKDGPARSVLGPVDAPVARAALTDLVALHREGLSRPLPLPTRAAAAYARTREDATRVKALGQAESQWTDRFSAERDDPAHVTVWGAGRALADVVGTSRGVEESEFAELALRLWRPLLAHEGA